MDTTKAYFVKRANLYGILYVRKRNCREDRTGWGALEFILNNGEIFVISGEWFGQGAGEEGLCVDTNSLKVENREQILEEIREKLVSFRRREMKKSPEKDSLYLTKASLRLLNKRIQEQLTKAPTQEDGLNAKVS